MKVKPVRELDPDGYRDKACLVRRNIDEYFVVSSVNTPSFGPETLAFRASKTGQIVSWTEVAGGKNRTREETIKELEEGEPSTWTP